MNNNSNNSEHKGMMWMMIPCLLLLGFLFFGRGTLFSSGGYLWPILIGGFVLVHIWMMFKGHSGHNDIHTRDKMDMSAQREDKGTKHTHSGACH